jgi:hypothetical protein
LGTTVGLLRTDGVAKGAGSSFKLMGLRPRWADTAMAEIAIRATASVILRIGVVYGA